MTGEKIIPSTRRDFLKGAILATSLAAITPSDAAQRAVKTGKITDVNVNLGRWPTRRLYGDDPATLREQLRRKGVQQAWAGSLEALLHKDITGVNDRLAAECKRHGRAFFVPFGSVSPKLPGWQAELRRCAEYHQMRGIRLHPNYHGYELTHPEFAQLLRAARDFGLIVQLAVVMEDERMMHPLLRVEPVDLTPLARILRDVPTLPFVLLNALGALRGSPLGEIISVGEVYVEISMLEGVGGVGNLLSQIPADRVLFGSHAPFFYFESAALKLKESALTEVQRFGITRDNAANILAKAR